MVTNNTDLKYIDIEKTFKESDSALLRKLPMLVVRFITRIIKQDEINRLLSKYSDNSAKDFLSNMIKEFNITLEIEGKENLPENGKCFFAANHPFGVIDGLVLTHIVSDKYGSLKAIANDAFMYLPPLRPFIAAVNVYERSSKEYITALDEVYNSNTPITHFPSGEVSRYYKGKVQDTVWQKSFITKAKASKRNIVPFYFFGKNSKLFYAIYRIRKFFGIGVNIELLLLPHEMFKKRNTTVKVKIGKPIECSLFDNTKSAKEWAQQVREQVYSLGKNN